MSGYNPLPDLNLGQFRFKDDPMGRGVSAYRSNFEYWKFIALIPPIGAAALHSWLDAYLTVHAEQLPDFMLGSQFLFKDDPQGNGVSAYIYIHQQWLLVETISPAGAAGLYAWLTMYLTAHPIEEA